MLLCPAAFAAKHTLFGVFNGVCWRAAASDLAQRVPGREAPRRIFVSPHRCGELPVEDSTLKAGAYAGEVLSPGAEEIYPEHSLLLCLPIAKFTGKLVKGRRLIVRRVEGARFEITVREVVTDGRGHFWLAHRSTDSYLTLKVRLPENLQRG